MDKCPKCGKKLSLFYVKQTCKECGCVYVFDGGDINYDHKEGDEWVNCPTCGEALRVNNRYNWEDEE